MNPRTRICFLTELLCHLYTCAMALTKQGEVARASRRLQAKATASSRDRPQPSEGPGEGDGGGQ